MPGCLQVVEVERDKLEILGILVGLKDDLGPGVGDVFVVGVEHLKNVLCSEKTMEGGRKRAEVRYRLHQGRTMEIIDLIKD